MKRRKEYRNPRLTFHKLDWLEWIAIGLSIWIVIHPVPYKLLFVVLMLLPILGIVLNGSNGRPSIASLFRIEKNRGSKNEYDVADFIDIAAWAIFIRIVKDFEFESFYSFIIPVTTAFLIVSLILFVTHRFIDKNASGKAWMYLSLTFNILIYSISGTYGINCLFDNSEPVVYDARVIDKHISKTRRSTSYYVKVTPWGHHLDSEKIEVPKDQFETISVGDHIAIDRHEGLLNIPWYYIE